MEEIVKNDYNLNISRYVSTAVAEEDIDLSAVNAKLTHLENSVRNAKEAHNIYLKELGLPELP
jgi:type I restriction enzyme M protein